MALPTACIVLALVGIPLGLSAKKGGKSTGFVLTIGLVFLYYFVSLLGVSLGRQGKLPPAIGVWLANVTFFITGAVLLFHADKRPLDAGGWLRSEVAHLRAWLRRKWRSGFGEGPGFESVARRRGAYEPRCSHAEAEPGPPL